ncbi:multiple epidermal growth factor-like domains protein 11 [Biomphalaria pfeifferi]|uniref:Multiple epidermal growth factor-like domains protein 11 n=1 Tax=Biomphalaria pfeifferi TaxID=112525 RepID=A0AAD8C1Z4_BIOPF|nr:multiple epidermal growth factor-like domains protein 11 [Biomphalaria pfeifferi]
MKVAITQITLSGEAVKSICSVHVSGGRNLALKQQTSQTSIHLNYESQFAVDGIVAPSCRFSGCSHTAVYDTTPRWSVTFNQAYSLNRFVLYNRLDSSTFRLKYFGLQVLDEKNSVIFNYTDTNHSNNQSVLYPDNKPAAIVKVVETHMNDILDAVPYVSLNEFEAYGECVPGRWGLDCNQLCPAHCQNSCSSENGSCSFICIGYSNPPNCTEACMATKWGTNCINDCSTSCLASVCGSSNGNCLSGCLGFSNPPVCTQECLGGYYGINCSDKCSDRCLNSLCNKTFGQCLACNSGFIGDDCNTKHTEIIVTQTVQIIAIISMGNVNLDIRICYVIKNVFPRSMDLAVALTAASTVGIICVTQLAEDVTSAQVTDKVIFVTILTMILVAFLLKRFFGIGFGSCWTWPTVSIHILSS